MDNRYYIEVAYNGKLYAGFQKQKNANTIQAEVEKALFTFYRILIPLTGSSRTDAGVHAFQNYFHADMPIPVKEKDTYNLNAILPADIVIKSMKRVAANAHCRFDAISRAYQYVLYQSKNPFLNDRAYYYPYLLNMGLLQEAAGLLYRYRDFESFAKKHHQAHTTNCEIFLSEWEQQSDCIIYRVTANRFLRGMVRGLVGTMLRVGRGKYSLDEFQKIIESKNISKTDFSAPAQGLTLVQIHFEL